MRRGFSLIELCYVLAIMGVLVGLTVPTYDVMYRNAQAAEARAIVLGIAYAEHRHVRDRGSYVECAPTGPIPTVPIAFPAQEPCWVALNLRPEGLVRYRYSVRLHEGSFIVRAEGDLDHDGVPGTLTLDGRDMEIVAPDGAE